MVESTNKQTKPLVKQTQQKLVIESEIPKATKSTAFKKLPRYTKMPSILAFSLILCYYGGKIKIKQLLLSLSLGGGEFYQSQVQNGALFKQSLSSSIHFTLNDSLYYEY